ncbi:MAG: MFS transporter [bacterium]
MSAPATVAPADVPLPWPQLARVFGVTLGLFIAFGCLLPVLPLWAESKLGSMTDVGLATTFAAGIGLILGRPVAARLMEGRDRAPTIVIGVALCSGAALLFPLLSTLWPILGVRTVQGMGFGMVTTAGVAAITDLSPPARRGQVLGYFGASNALSLIVGPALGGAVARGISFNATFYLAAGLGLLPLLALIGIREPAKVVVAGRKRLLEALKLPKLKGIVAAHFFTLMIHGAILTFLPKRMAGHTGFMTAEAFYLIDGLVLILFRVGVGRRFDVIGRGRFIFGGLVAIVASTLLLALTEHDATWIAAAALYGVGFGAYVPASNALVGDVVPETHRARGFAVFMLAFDVAMACGGGLFGPVAEHGGIPLALLCAAACTAVGGVVWAVSRSTRA